MKKQASNPSKFLILFLSILFFIATAGISWGKTHYIELSDSYWDGTAHGVVGGDTVVIAAGNRGDLLLQNFNGTGTYINVVNENLGKSIPVTITTNGAAGKATLSISNCKYVNISGNNDYSVAYGIKVVGDNTPAKGAVSVYGESDHIKIQYCDISFTGKLNPGASALMVQDTGLSNKWTFDNFEISYNYIHNTGYAGMYLGHNDPLSYNSPYLANFSIHDNILKDLGSYGITFKGVTTSSNYIYNNNVTTTGIIRTDLEDQFKQGIGIAYFYGTSTVKISSNYIANTAGPGIKVVNMGHPTPVADIYKNTIIGCGTGGSKSYGHGIDMVTYVLSTINIYDNTISKAYGYGLFAGGGTSGNYNNNLISLCGLGELGPPNGGGLWVEVTDNDSDTYKASVDDSLPSSISAPTGLHIYQ